jgi:hypothetical protein
MEFSRDDFFYNLNEFRSNQLFSDVILECEGVFFSCHKVILASMSGKFEKVLKKLPSKRDIVIITSDLSPRVLNELLKFGYGGYVDVPLEYLEEFHAAAVKYEFRGFQPTVEDESDETSEPDPPNCCRQLFSEEPLASSTQVTCLIPNSPFHLMGKSLRATSEVKYFPEVFPKIGIIVIIQVGHQICQIPFEPGTLSV